jgi:hypothetical protein
MLSSGTLIFVAFICASGGFLIGALVIYLSGSRRPNKTKPTPTKESKEVKGGKAEELKSPYREILRLVRDPVNGKILTEMDGKILPPSKDMNEDQRKILMQLARDWVEWLGYRGPQAASKPDQQAASTPTAPTLKPEGSLLKYTAASRQPLTTTPAVEPIPAVPKLFPTRTVEPRPAPKSIVGQIDDVLQEMLAQNNMQGLAIRLAEEPQQGVIVWVGTTRYIGIDSVTDTNIKAVVHAAVTEWERRSEKSRL